MSTLLGLDVLCDHRLAFIGCDREILPEQGQGVSRQRETRPPPKNVAPVWPTVEPDETGAAGQEESGAEPGGSAEPVAASEPASRAVSEEAAEPAAAPAAKTDEN